MFHLCSCGSYKIELDPFPGEQVLAHEGRTWKASTITKLAPHELVTVAETGIPPAVSEIVDIPLDDFPEHPPSHPDYERPVLRRPGSDAVRGSRQRTSKNTGHGFTMNPGRQTNHNHRVATFSIYNYYGFVGFIVVIGGLRPVIIVMTPGM